MKEAGRNDELLLTEVARTNELLEQLLAEAKHANELTRWQIEAQKVAV